MMIEEAALNSILLLDKLLANTIETINKLEDPEYKSIITSNTITKVNALLNLIYKDRASKNFRSAMRKCIFLKKYIEREMRSVYES